MSSTRKLYDRAFKVMAVELCLNGQASQQVAEDLGIRVQMLNRWKKEYLQPAHTLQYKPELSHDDVWALQMMCPS
ncbi:transposase [Xanthocytophaga agilis]|uniref:Transposase n=1 Tax=Xanthocytophaga agilis TaxID=3048010 RepID=A0AAE3R7Q1_9BACT|nr:transposase [Xanthocytophaga agilis]MDJ1504740.1 transposase [Xanthocytophaga agilis]